MSWRYEAKKDKDTVGPIDAFVVVNDEKELLQNKGKHSPDGFQIGYGGSGPADLAYSILWDHFTRVSNQMSVPDIRTKVVLLYQKFKEYFIVPAKNELKIDGENITWWLSVNDWSKIT